MQERNNSLGNEDTGQREMAHSVELSLEGFPAEVFDAFIRTSGLRFEGEQKQRVHHDTRYVKMMRASIWNEEGVASSMEES